MSQILLLVYVNIPLFPEWIQHYRCLVSIILVKQIAYPALVVIAFNSILIVVVPLGNIVICIVGILRVVDNYRIEKFLQSLFGYMLFQLLLIIVVIVILPVVFCLRLVIEGYYAVPLFDNIKFVVNLIDYFCIYVTHKA